ncbi:MAG TPA: glycoside hydrolase family 13 protein, partial [Patescibacteria group bacterium]|nr:glycoside hydrolase family 13 protein [Patescibacteria group bacterium]
MSIVTPAWVRDAVFYQIFPDRFAASARVPKPGPLESWEAPPTATGFKGGDLLGVAEHLDHLVGLGVNAIYFNPIFKSASNHRYHTYDYMAVDPLLGGDAALRELLDACHARGIRVVLDGVFNHASRGFWPFNHVMEVGWDSPYRDWFYFDQDALRSGRQVRAFPDDRTDILDLAEAPWDRLEGRNSLRELGYRAWWDLPALPKLNTDNPQVREYLYGVAEHWIRFGIDGWRLDVPEEIKDVKFWREFRRRVTAVNPDAYIVAEIWDERPEALGGDQYHGLMNYPLMAAVLSFVAADHHDDAVIGAHFTIRAHVRRDDAAAFAQRLEHILTIYDPAVVGAQLNLLDSHDTPRFLTMAGGDVASFRLATLVQMTVPGAPSIYYGDEIGLPGGFDPDCRRSFPWQAPETWDHDLLAYVSAASALRHAN